MKWLKKEYGNYELKDYPFFNIIIMSTFSGKYYLYNKHCERNVYYDDIESAKTAMLDFIINNISECINFDCIKDSKVLIMDYDKCNSKRHYSNINQAKYNNSKWLDGRCVINEKPSKTTNYAMRFDSCVSEEYVKNHGLKVINKHIRKFKKEYLNNK